MNPDNSAPRQAGARVEMEALCRRFGATLALDGFSLGIEPGELVSLLGPSGCGKTTALRVLAGFETLDSGQVLLDGAAIGNVPPQRRDMGMVFQGYSLFPNMTARDNVAFGLRMRGRATSARNLRAAEMLDMVGLGDQVGRYPHQLSGGQQQRVALARALAIEPRVLLLDEPLSALDAQVRLQLREQIKVLQARLGTTTVFVTHDQEEALSISDRVCVMRAGHIEQVDAPAVLYAQPANVFVAEFVGTMNRVPGRIVGAGVEVLGRTVAVRDSTQAGLGTEVDVLVRPEELCLEALPHGRAIVMAKTFLGPTTRVSVLLDSEVLAQVDQPSALAARLESGSAVEVSLTAAEVMIAPPRSGPRTERVPEADKVGPSR